MNERFPHWSMAARSDTKSFILENWATLGEEATCCHMGARLSTLRNLIGSQLNDQQFIALVWESWRKLNPEGFAEALLAHPNGNGD